MNTRRTLLNFTTAFRLFAILVPAMAQSSKRISITQMESMFENMRAKTKWNVDGPLLWGYFFFDQSIDKLKLASKELEASGYRIVQLDAVGDKQRFRLHVERVEAHTPASLNARNIEFYALAEKYSIASYDGMDVGPASVPMK
jgi:hypothetical protein